METRQIEQTITFDATPEEVYDLIMNQEKHSAFTESEASISTELNGKFKVFEGYCHGYNIELIKGKKIVQAWHFDEDGWPDSHFSICTFIFESSGNGTKLSFLQTDIPAHKAESLAAGWKEYYWEPMKTYLKSIQ
jgi:activator of HSP90 ATPase